MNGLWVNRCGNCGHPDLVHGFTIDNALGSCEARKIGMPCMCYVYVTGTSGYEEIEL